MVYNAVVEYRLAEVRHLVRFSKKHRLTNTVRCYGSGMDVLTSQVKRIIGFESM